jgi:hypothetical protein
MPGGRPSANYKAEVIAKCNIQFFISYTIYSKSNENDFFCNPILFAKKHYVYILIHSVSLQHASVASYC